MGTTIILSLYLKPCQASMPCFMVTNSVPKADVSAVDVSLRTIALMLCLHVSTNHFLTCKTLCPLHDHYPQTCGYLPLFLEVLVTNAVFTCINKQLLDLQDILSPA